MKTKRDVLFVYATKENRKYINEITKKYNKSISYIINRILEVNRESKTPLGIKKSIPKYVAKSEQWLVKNLDQDTEDTLKTFRPME